MLHLLKLFRCACFNPRSRTGSDTPTVQVDNANTGFNPRSRTGSDRQRLSVTTPLFGFNPRSRTGSDCDPFSPLPCNDMQGIFREGHEPRIKFVLSKTTQKIYYNKIILLKNRVPPRKMLCASGSRGLSARSTHIPSSATLVSADTLSLPLRNYVRYLQNQRSLRII